MQCDHDASTELTNKKRLLQYFSRMGFGVSPQSKIINCHLQQDQQHGFSINPNYLVIYKKWLDKYTFMWKTFILVLNKARSESQIASLALGRLLQLRIWPKKLSQNVWLAGNLHHLLVKSKPATGSVVSRWQNGAGERNAERKHNPLSTSPLPQAHTWTSLASLRLKSSDCSG